MHIQTCSVVLAMCRTVSLQEDSCQIGSSKNRSLSSITIVTIATKVMDFKVCDHGLQVCKGTFCGSCWQEGWFHYNSNETNRGMLQMLKNIRARVSHQGPAPSTKLAASTCFSNISRSVHAISPVSLETRKQNKQELLTRCACFDNSGYGILAAQVAQHTPCQAHQLSNCKQWRLKLQALSYSFWCCRRPAYAAMLCSLGPKS